MDYSAGMDNPAGNMFHRGTPPVPAGSRQGLFDVGTPGTIVRQR
jgi:hypothetical protein